MECKWKMSNGFVLNSVLKVIEVPWLFTINSDDVIQVLSQLFVSSPEIQVEYIVRKKTKQKYLPWLKSKNKLFVAYYFW